jgi:hypothetical protein
VTKSTRNKAARPAVIAAKQALPARNTKINAQRRKLLATHYAARYRAR